MPRPTSKTELLADCRQEFDALEKFVETLPAAQLTEPGAIGDWSVKDVLAHLYEWHQMFFRWYETSLRGETPAVPAEGYKWNELPALNQAIYEHYRDYLLDDVVSSLRASHQKTVGLIEELDEEILFKRGLYPWMNKNYLAAYLASNTGSHYRWARTEMRKALRKKGAI
ncbi:MAG: ClbS/DfsB family four-helix bundle protein [Anaerolineae bacterium]|nr:ClbS/DfsB family four-helix bundle protein [Anaerolineae bacterium]